MFDYASKQAWELAILRSLGSPSWLAPFVERHDTGEFVNDIMSNHLRDANCTLGHYQVHEALVAQRSLSKWALGATSDLAQAAKEGFLERNRTCCCRDLHWSIVSEMRRLLHLWLPQQATLTDSLPRLGPGAVAEHFSWLRKRRLLPRAADAYWNLGHQMTDHIADHDMARLCAVPKNEKKMRLITVEPYFNTLLQQAARLYVFRCMQEGLKGYFWQHFWDIAPSVQGHRAVYGSTHPEVATIDLTDASDGISYDLVCQVMPAHIMYWLDLSRTTHISDGDETYCLNIYAGMGNATTFLVETLVFLAYVTAVAHRYKVKTYTTVFGDDIVCSSELMMRGLLTNDTQSFFKINSLKSYWSCMPFRESCGVFAYKGVDVRPFFVKGYRTNLLEERLALCDLQHRLQRSRYLCDNLLSLQVVEDSSWNIDVMGDHPYFYEPALPLTRTPKRYNTRLQRIESRLEYIRERPGYLPAVEAWMPAAANIGAISTVERRGSYEVPFPTGRYQRTKVWVPTISTPRSE